MESLFEIKKQLLFSKICTMANADGIVHGFSNQKVSELLGTKIRQSHKYMKSLERDGKISIRIRRFKIPSSNKWFNERIISVLHQSSKEQIEEKLKTLRNEAKKVHKHRLDYRKELIKRFKEKIKEVDFLDSEEPEEIKIHPRMMNTKIPHIIADMTAEFDFDKNIEKVSQIIRSLRG